MISKESGRQPRDAKSYRIQHLLLGTLVLFVSLGLFAVVAHFHEQVFYNQPHDDPRDLWRFLWMVPFIFLGLGARAFIYQHHPGSPWSEYSTYGVYVAVASGLLFIVVHSALPVDDWLYYVFAPMATFLFALVPRKAMGFIKGLFEDDDSATTT